MPPKPSVADRSPAAQPAVAGGMPGGPAGPPNAEVWLGLAVAAVAFVVFLPAVACDFVNWDDNYYVYDNPDVLAGLTPAGLLRAWTTPVFGGWMPLTVMSYQLDAALAGARPWCYHLTNVLVHAASAGLLAVALARMTAQPGRAGLAALLFAVHPLRVESVAWVAERKDVLSVLFLVLTVLAYERFCRRPGGRGALGAYLGVGGAMLASLLCKATFVTLPLLLGLCDLWPLRRIRPPTAACEAMLGPPGERYPPVTVGRAMLEKLPLLVLGLIFARITLATQAAFVVSPLGMSFLRARLPNAIEAIGFYCGKTFWPTGLQPAIYHVGTDRDWPAVAAGLTAVSLLAGLALGLRRRLPAVSWGIAWFGVALLPVLGIVQTGFQAYADRFTYAPHVGMAVAVTWASAAVCDRLRMPVAVRLGAAGLVVAVLAGTSVRQIGVWHDGQTLWNHTLQLDPGHPIALGKLGNLAFIAGDYTAAADLYESSLRRQEYAWVIAGLARTHHRLGHVAERDRYRAWAERVAGGGDQDARTMLAELPGPQGAEAAPESRPSDRPPVTAEVRRLLEAGSTALARQEFAAALAAFDQAVAADRACAAAHNLAGIALVGLDRHPDAARRFARATEIEPGNFGFWVNLARSRADLRDWAGCLAAAERAVALDPADAEAAALRDRARNKAGPR